MTDDPMTELLDLYVSGELPEAVQTHVEAYLQAHPDAARDVRSLRETVTRLQSAPAERPDAWFTERLLGRLLREDAEASPEPVRSYRS